LIQDWTAAGVCAGARVPGEPGLVEIILRQRSYDEAPFARILARLAKVSRD
jgi:hypothetical protein